MFYVDLGYDFVDDENKTLEFTSITEANNFANEVLRQTGEVLAVTST